ncbi:MAG: orotidine-5'-phosphate decarboxylase [Proteobacteria bacterium]|jgi:orotidine-5'-phosphate decarboxylase|nr:orotidine-5'-phosphate decarboxylase [Pseudomonadota bacterium]
MVSIKPYRVKAPSRPQDKIIIALDVPDTDSALRLIDALGEAPALCKIGLELFTSQGPSVVKAVQSRGSRVFLDLKFHDIPNTVAHAVKSAARLGVAMTTLHASGGPVMLEAAAKAAEGSDLLLLAVTVLTSMDSAQLGSTGISVEPKDQVLRLATLAFSAGIVGIVCSPLEVTTIRGSLGNNLRIVTPGVRPTWAAAGDQKRVMTPAEAVQAGSDWLVIGRPITAAQSPKEAYAKVVAELI